MFVTPEQIYAVTNGGLDVIIQLYPTANECVTNTRKKFRIRQTDKTASASLKQKMPEGIWLVTDFGGDQKPRNCIECVRLVENLDYKEAIQWIANKYNIIPIEQQTAVIKADFSSRPATDDEKEGDFSTIVKDAFSDFDLSTLFSVKIIENYRFNYKDNWAAELNKVCKSYNFFSLKSFTRIKDRKANTIASNERYPIFLIEAEGFKKIYQPLNQDKAYRFHYHGERPKDYLMGYKRLEKEYSAQLQKEIEKAEGKGYTEPDEIKKQTKDFKLKEAILCSGEGDAINCAAMGYYVLWQNSETATLPGKKVVQLRKMVEDLYNVPDIDITGLREGHKLALEYMDIKTIWLPSELRGFKDKRGNPCKDLRDYLNHFDKKSFTNLVKMALPYKFWNEDPQFTRDGEFKRNSIQPANIRMYNFLMRNGFFRFEIPNEKEGYTYIQIIGNTVYQIRNNKVKEFINNFLEHRQRHAKTGHTTINEDVRNAFVRTTQLGENSLSNLGLKQIDFIDFDKTTQWVFFLNKTWQITKAGITEHLPNDIERYVWDNELIKHRVELKPAPYNITSHKSAGGEVEYDITINDSSCLFLRYLVNASRVHWRKEFETVWTPDQETERLAYIEANKFNIAGPKLSPDEIKEQKRHLVNKLFTLGYLLHRYKDPSRPWCVYAMDARPADDGESFGGSGKSIAYKAVRYFMNSVTLDGRNKRLTQNPHIYEMVSEHTDYILIDDADQYLDFDFFFAPLTGDLPVNPKNNKQFTIPFELVPKFCITSNYTLRKIDSSTFRRILYSVFSDYYHYNTNNEYKETRSPKDDFGKNLFLDFTEEEWNLFFNTMAYACAFYMNVEKIEPPMNNVERRNLETQMGEAFHNWAAVYFSPESGRLNTMVQRTEAFEEFRSSTNSKLYTPQRFSKALTAFCRYYQYELNPVDFQNSDGRIIRKLPVLDKQGNPITGKETSYEMIYIKSDKEIKTEVQPFTPTLPGIVTNPNDGPTW